MDRLEFVHPWALWLLLLPLALFFWKGAHGRPLAVRLPSTLDALASGGVPRSAAGGFRFLPVLLGMALLLIALARPRLGKGATEVEFSGIDILLTLDVSGSMEAMDFKLNGQPVNRLEAVKDVVAKFITERPNDKIGMVAFAGRPYMVGPLTLDHNWLGQRLKDVMIGQVEDGTAIGSAIASAVDHLKDSEAKSRIVILLTDGVNNAGAVNPETSAEAAKQLGIKIYTIGAGTMGEAPMPVRDPFGGVRYQMQKVEIDEAVLTKVSDLTGGRYYRATDSDSLRKIYDEINLLETTPRKLKKYEDYEELYLVPLVLGIAVMLIGWILEHTVLRRLP